MNIMNNQRLKKSKSFKEKISKLDSLRDSKIEETQNHSYSVIFCPETKNQCVGMVDMVNSTQISAILEIAEMSRYYQIFLNSMSNQINDFDGKVIKNIGDCLLFYFPNQLNENQESYLTRCLDCCFSMIALHDIMCKQLRKENLPCLDYRISVDYGKVIFMKTNNSDSIDMIGTPINLCAKINHRVPPNGVVSGGDVYEMIKKS